jgi:predicted O-methyltransferase YrrM
LERALQIMTSREITPILALSTELSVERTTKDWAMLLAFGSVQWPWLLKSLYGGRKKDKAALLERLGLPLDALPNLGSWKADTGLLNFITDTILEMRPNSIVELGAGASTLVASRALSLSGSGGRLVSFDQHADFVDATRLWLGQHGEKADIRHSPLASSTGEYKDLWYDLSGVPDHIDLLLIDGPPWALNPLIRSHAQSLFNRMTPGGMVILDDAARPGERVVARQWSKHWPEFDWAFTAKGKGILVGRKR